PIDLQRNNIYRDDVIQALGSVTPDVANSVMANVNPLFAGGDLATLGGLYYRIQSGSPARNIGTTVSGISHGFIDGSNPDAGAYEYNDPAPWVPGYNAVPFEGGD